MTQDSDKPGTEEHKCIRCGVKTDNHMGDVYICETCYEIRSSCCPEFGADDLTEQGDDSAELKQN